MNFPFKSERSYTTQCPQCGEGRKKGNTYSLSVYNDPDGYTRYKCNHEGQCEWNTWQYIKTPEEINEQVSLLPTPIEDETFAPLPIELDLPGEWRGNKLWWYRTYEGEGLFACMRVNEINGRLKDGALDNDPERTGKVYFPVLYNDNGPSGKPALQFGKWPKRRGFYNAQKIRESETILIVEGEKTADAAQSLFPKVACITWRNGTPGINNGDWETDEFVGKKVYLWPDNDTVGIDAMKKISTLIKNGEIFLVNTDWIEEGKKDLADNLPLEEIKEALKNAQPINKHKIKGLSLDELDAQSQRYLKKFSTGWDSFDQSIALPSSGVVVVEGRKGHAKTGSAVNLGLRFLLSGGKVFYYIYEFPGVRLKKRFTDITTYMFETEKGLQLVNDWISEGRLNLIDKDLVMTFTSLIKELDDEELRGSLVVLDYAQIIPVPESKMREKMMTLMQKITDLANKHGFLVILLSQVTPDMTNPLNDTPRDSKDIHMWAEMVVRVWNKDKKIPHQVYDQIDGNYTWHILENRDGQANQLVGFEWKQGKVLEPTGEVKDAEYRRPREATDSSQKIAKSLEIIAHCMQAKSFDD